MFVELLISARARGLSVGVGEHLTLLEALSKGVATDIDGLYHLGRAIYCSSETEYDAWDLAFAETFQDVRLPPDLRENLAQWLEQAAEREVSAVGDWTHLDREELLKKFLERLAEQKEHHDGGNHWIGTKGTSPFGHSGNAKGGMRVGGAGGGRQAMNMALERRWEGYRTDRVLDIRDLQVVLRTLRDLGRVGRVELDLDETIDQTAKNAGDIEIVERRERKNRLDVVLLMDAGGSMGPHARRVEQLFTAASKLDTFRSFASYTFHNCIYRWLYADDAQRDRVPTHEVLANLKPHTRLVFVGDASMAPYELFSGMSWPGEDALSGIEWLRRFKARCSASVWLNPDPPRLWRHPTVSAIGGIFPMYELTVSGMRDAVKTLRVPV